MNDKYYELKQVYNGREIIMRFDADVNINELYEHLRDFLTGCGWCKESLDKLFDTEE